MIEHMFEGSGARSQAEIIAGFDEAFEGCVLRTATAESEAWVERVAAAVRAENRAAAAQLVAIGELFAYRLSQCSETEEWAIDTMEAVAAEVGAGLRISQAMAASRIRYARAMRERLPKVAARCLSAGTSITERFRPSCSTDLIDDPEVLARVDGVVAASVTRWPSMTNARLSRQGRCHRRAGGRRCGAPPHQGAGRSGDLHRPRQDGISHIEGRLFSVDAHALDQRLSALAATVCAHDPRTAAQRRADALGALAAGADRLGCRCARHDCAAGGRPGASPVVMHVIAEQATLEGAQRRAGVGGRRRRADPPRTASANSPRRPSWCRWSTPVTPHPNPATRPRRRWPTSCAAAT